MRRISRPDVRFGYRIPLNAYLAQAHRDPTLDREKRNALWYMLRWIRPRVKSAYVLNTTIGAKLTLNAIQKLRVIDLVGGPGATTPTT